MISHLAAHVALRARARTVVVASTGSMSLAATATGYTRASGSFIADLFYVGMEVTPAGFATNTVDVITAVSAGAITVKNARAVEVAAGGRSLTVGFPALFGSENSKFTPIAGRPYIEEDFVPATSVLLGAPANGSTIEETGIYALKWYGLPNVGTAALRASVDALRALFAPHTTFAVSGGTLRVRGDVSSQTGQIIPLDGWAALVLTVPWRAQSINTIT